MPVTVKSCLFTDTSIVAKPAFIEGAAHTIWFAVRDSAATGVEPNLHIALPLDGKFTPSTVTLVPPLTTPALG